MPMVLNPFCRDLEFLTNGYCKLGWTFIEFNEENRLTPDWTTSVICRNPEPIKGSMTGNSVCKRFELSTTSFKNNDLNGYILGEYVIKDMIYNGRVVYEKPRRLDQPKTYLYFETRIGLGAGVLERSFAMAIGSDYGIIMNNPTCGNLLYPANGKCNDGWYFFANNLKRWEYDSNMSVKCMEL